MDWPEIRCLREVSTMFYICRYCVFTWDGSIEAALDRIWRWIDESLFCLRWSCTVTMKSMRCLMDFQLSFFKYQNDKDIFIFGHINQIKWMLKMSRKSVEKLKNISTSKVPAGIQTVTKTKNYTIRKSYFWKTVRDVFNSFFKIVETKVEASK